jgi:hypothetical protein
MARWAIHEAQQFNSSLAYATLPPALTAQRGIHPKDHLRWSAGVPGALAVAQTVKTHPDERVATTFFALPAVVA